MCFGAPTPKAPAPVAPPPPPAPSATEIEEPGQRRKKGSQSQLEGLRIPLRPVDVPQAPRLGL